MKKLKRPLLCLLAIMSVISIFLPYGYASAAPVESETVLAVAVHVSENTKAHGLSLTASGGEYAWEYFQIYTLLEEMLIADGTPYVEVSDAQIAAGALLSASGKPKYPIFISLAAECISDAQAQAIKNYVSAGGFAYAGSSAWTRDENGSPRPDFALAAEMGVNSAAVGTGNWISMGVSPSRVKKIAEHPIVSHLPSGVNIIWQMADGYKTYESDGSHRAWKTTANGATELAVVEGTASRPFLTVKAYGSGQFIYHAELSPLAGWAGANGNAILFEYAIFRNAIEWAFTTQNLPLIRVSAWPYPYQSAFIMRHDDTTIPPEEIVLAEEERDISGQYYVVTDWDDGPDIGPSLLEAMARGAVIGTHSINHPYLDSLTYSQANWQLDESLNQIEEWTGVRPNTWVAPYFAAVIDQSFQVIVDNDITVTGGEQSVGPFPHYALSMTTEQYHYNLLELPPTFWINSSGTPIPANDGQFTYQTIENAVDFIYGLGGMVGIYDHVGSIWLGLVAKNQVIHYMDYASSKPWMWKATPRLIEEWWPDRSPVQLSSVYSLENNNHELEISVSGASNPLISLDVTLPGSDPVTVKLDGSATSTFRQSGAEIKINSGTADTVELDWRSGNYPPEAANDTYTAYLNSQLSVGAPGVLGNDSDADVDTLSAVKLTDPAHGTVTLNSNGSFVYNPVTGYTGPDSFTYRAYDGQEYSAAATVYINVTNTLGTFGYDSGPYTWQEPADGLNAMRFQNTAGTGTLSKLEIQFQDAYPQGKVRLGVYADNSGKPGALLVDAGEANVANGWVSVSGLNLPVTQNTYYWLSFCMSAQNGVRLRPGASQSHYSNGYTFGAFPAQFPLSGADVNSYPFVMRATVSAPANTPPVAVDDSYSTAEDTVLTVPAPGVLGNDTDAEGNPLTAIKVTDPTHGTVALNADGSFTYTPNTNYNGNDSFTYQASDGQATSNTATVNLNITPVNDAPVANDDNYSTSQGTVLNVTAPGVLGNDTDIEGNQLTAIKLTDPLHGTLTLNPNGSFTYTPEAGYTGADSFTYKASDGIVDSSTAIVNINISALTATFGLDQGNNSFTEPRNFLTGLWFRNVAGTGILTKLEVRFQDTTPSGKIRMGVYADNAAKPGSLLLDAGEVTITNGWVAIDGLNLPVTEGTYYWLAFVLQDPNTIYYQSGQASGSHYWATFSYGSLPGQFILSGVSEFGSNSNQYVMRATVSSSPPVNDPPVAVNDNYSIDRDTVLSVPAPGVLANDTDAQGSPLTAVKETDPTHGTLTLNSNGSFTYIPEAGYVGPDFFTYKASDGTDMSNTATVNINVTPVNDPPVAVNDSFNTFEDTLLNVPAPGVLDNDTDTGGGPLTAIKVTNPAHGTVTLNADGSFVYTPDANYFGNDSFTYQASDGQKLSNIATVSINIAPVNDPPVAATDSYTMTKDTVLIVSAPGVLGNDTDTESNPLTAIKEADPLHGTVALNSDGSFTYTPEAGFAGEDTFTYKANDGSADSSTAVVTILVNDMSGPQTFGLDEGDTSQWRPGNYLTVNRFQNTAGTGNLTKLEILFDGSANDWVHLGVYADNNGQPGSLLLDAGIVQVVDGWVVLDGLSLPVAQGEYYWLAFDCQEWNSYRIQTGTALRYYLSWIYNQPLPSAFPVSSSSSTPGWMVMRATVSP